MSWFDEQIKQRKLNDNAEIEEGFLSIADAVLGSKRHSQFASDDTKAQDAIEEILLYVLTNDPISSSPKLAK